MCFVVVVDYWSYFGNVRNFGWFSRQNHLLKMIVVVFQHDWQSLVRHQSHSWWYLWKWSSYNCQVKQFDDLWLLLVLNYCEMRVILVCRHRRRHRHRLLHKQLDKKYYLLDYPFPATNLLPASILWRTLVDSLSIRVYRPRIMLQFSLFSHHFSLANIYLSLFQIIFVLSSVVWYV